MEKLKKVEYMQGFIGDVFDGVISGVTAKGFFVELENTVEGMVSTQSLLDDYYLFDEQQYRLEGKRTGRVFTLGQKVRVVAESANKTMKTIDFVLEEFSSASGWDVYGEEIRFDGTEEDWYSDDEENWIRTKDDIAKNDWLDDEEADRLLSLYAKKDIKEIGS